MAGNSTYMIVTPSPLDANGIVDNDGHVRWMIKIGDGDAEAAGRYQTHNPDYNLSINANGRRGTAIKNAAFTVRDFKTPYDRNSEWFVAWDRPDLVPAIRLEQGLLTCLDAWTTHGAGAAGQTAAIASLVLHIPTACATPPP